MQDTTKDLVLQVEERVLAHLLRRFDEMFAEELLVEDEERRQAV